MPTDVLIGVRREVGRALIDLGAGFLHDPDFTDYIAQRLEELFPELPPAYLRQLTDLERQRLLLE